MARHFHIQEKILVVQLWTISLAYSVLQTFLNTVGLEKVCLSRTVNERLERSYRGQ